MDLKKTGGKYHHGKRSMMGGKGMMNQAPGDDGMSMDGMKVKEEEDHKKHH